MLFKLSIKNIKKSIKDYTIYFFTLVMAVIIFYVFNSLDSQNSMANLSSNKLQMIKTLVKIISYVSVFVSIILGFLIIYSNNFLIKRRKKEMGLYMMLGMKKRDVSTILVIETILVGILSLIIGLILGVFLSQGLSVLTAKLFEVDMQAFTFVFSKAALIKTVIYFGAIFLLVMIFNVISLSRYKLIDLLSAHKRNEKVKFRNKYILLITFILTIICYFFAYKNLFNGALYELNENTLKMMILGAIGTLLLFFSLSGVLLQLVKLIKSLYYKNLNIFVLKQINNKVNTTVVSTTIITLMLLLTIVILSTSISMVGAFNNNFSENNLTDFTVIQSDNPYIIGEDDSFLPINMIGFQNIVDDVKFKDYVDKYVQFDIYEDSNISLNTIFTNDTKEKISHEYSDLVEYSSLPIIKYSDYLKIVDLYGRDDLKYNLNDEEYLILCNVDKIKDYYQESIRSNVKLNLDGKELTCAHNSVINIAYQNFTSSGNTGMIVVNDELLEKSDVSAMFLIGNYLKTDNIEELEKNFQEYLSKDNNYPPYIITKLEMEASRVGIKAMLTFIGLYLGIIFAISSATILAIGQLSESSDNKERFNILKLIGTDQKMMNKALFIQIFIAFMIPLIVAIIHSIFALKQMNSIIEMFGNIDISKNIFLTTLFIIIVYGGYFIATYFSSKNIVKEDN